MGLTRYKIGELIELVTETNSELTYRADDVKGVTITKEIIPTKANVKDTDLSNFLIVQPNEFIFNPRTHGKKIGFGYNNSNKTFLISWNNIAFRLSEQGRKLVLPQYIFLHFNRSEWDRAACFSSWGSSTEVFSWHALCDMDIDLPPLSVQQKYVDVYSAMVANQKAYERGLEDLKLTCDALIDNYKNKSSKKRVADMLREVDIRNSDGTISDVQGININKQFIPSHANVNGIDLTKYKVVSKGDFAFSGMQTGRDECIRIALFDKLEPIVISPAYTVLSNQDDSALSEYVLMWFSRNEIDRLGWFLSDASIRTNLDMDCFNEIEIPIPPLPIQQSIVDIYTVYQRRQVINEKLKAQIKAVCPILIKGSLEEGKRTKEA
ncbi:restriction endonuclease subunit S [Aedoeadaptatus coli]|uniref:restriction endonuclease subunit S n=1 Tax=Aedoeadaptatus coli TaxID=2058292 RepID=UPI000D550595|nr:restriction endonuclease subunit S [Peptoniphilus coli]